MPTPGFILELRSKVGNQPLWLNGCSVVVLREGLNGTEVLLVKRTDNGMWTCVTGIPEPGEAPHQAAVRECAEETGVRIEIERMVLLGVHGPITYPNGDVTSYVDHLFRGHPVGGQAHVGDDESSEVGWFAVTGLPAPMSVVERRRIETASANPRDVLLVGDEAADDFPNLSAVERWTTPGASLS